MHIEPAGTRPRCYALVPCAGTGSRAGTPLPKQYARVAHQPVVAHTLQALAAVARLETLLVVLSPDDDRFEALVPVDSLAAAGERLQVARVGGATRAETVRNGLLELQARGAQPQDWVLVHDAARCLLQPAAVARLMEACENDEVGGLLALPVADTLKDAATVAGSARAARTLDRHGKWAAQTPQMFRLGLLLPALQAALADGGAWVTDEASAVEALGHQPRLVPGDLDNLKLTFPADFAWAERVFAGRTVQPAPQTGAGMTNSTAPTTPVLRIGEGNDIHALVPGRPLVLGGLTLPHSLGLLGHSDADALLHAVTDAVLGAAGLGDIGRHFPDSDERFRGADSARLLQEAVRRVREAGWTVVNVDATIVAQAPRLAAYLPAMGERVAACLGVAAEAVNIKAKTAERMGPVGEGRAIETRAVCLLQRAG